MDNYEWQESYRSEAKFGLFKIDIDSSKNNGLDNPQRKQDQHPRRQLTKGAGALKLIIKESVSKKKSGMIVDSAISKQRQTMGYSHLIVQA